MKKLICTVVAFMSFSFGVNALELTPNTERTIELLHFPNKTIAPILANLADMDVVFSPNIFGGNYGIDPSYSRCKNDVVSLISEVREEGYDMPFMVATTFEGKNILTAAMFKKGQKKNEMPAWVSVCIQNLEKGRETVWAVMRTKIVASSQNPTVSASHGDYDESLF
jgi:hypothetical protein